MMQATAEFSRFAIGRAEPGKRAAGVMAVAVHVLLAMFLIYGVQWQTSAPETVSVDLVREVPTASVDAPVVLPEKPQPVKETEEPPAPAKADILRKAPDKPKTIKEKATQSIDAISRLLQKETDRMINRRITDAAERERAQIKATQASSARNNGLADYMAKVRGKIRGNIVVPPGTGGNPELIFLVTQLPSGEVLSVKLKTSSGNDTLDKAVERAILKSSPLPKPDDSSLYEHDLILPIHPLNN